MPVRDSQEIIQSLIEGNPNVRNTQTFIQSLIQADSNVINTQTFIQSLIQANPNVINTQTFIQVLIPINVSGDLPVLITDGSNNLQDSIKSNYIYAIRSTDSLSSSDFHLVNMRFLMKFADDANVNYAWRDFYWQSLGYATKHLSVFRLRDKIDLRHDARLFLTDIIDYNDEIINEVAIYIMPFSDTLNLLDAIKAVGVTHINIQEYIILSDFLRIWGVSYLRLYDQIALADAISRAFYFSLGLRDRLYQTDYFRGYLHHLLGIQNFFTLGDSVKLVQNYRLIFESSIIWLDSLQNSISILTNLNLSDNLNLFLDFLSLFIDRDAIVYLRRYLNDVLQTFTYPIFISLPLSIVNAEMIKYLRRYLNDVADIKDQPGDSLKFNDSIGVRLD